MKIWLLILGIIMIVVSIVILALTDGAFFMYGLLIVGPIFIISGLMGKRTFKCMECAREFTTKDNQQGNIITCPYCTERYLLKGNMIYNMNKLEEIVSRTPSPQETLMCPDCGDVLSKEAEFCGNCGASVPLR